MMKAVLFAGAASVVFGQFCTQLQSTDANCTQNAWFNCSVVAAKCTRKPTMGVANASACSTESKASCVVDNCAAGTALANITSCSKCVDQCTTMTAQGSCEAAPACMWNNATCGYYVAPTPAPVRHCWDLKSQSTCTAADNCFWFSASETVCGGAAPREGCVPCNSTYTVDHTFNDAVQRALVVGDYKGAVAQCIAADKMADALVIAQVGGPSLWETTRDQYLKKNRSPYLKVVAAMVNNDLVSLVNTRPLKSWKETLALLCTFAQREEWTLLCDTLASRLVASGNTLAATLCYICAGNIDKTVEIWSKNVTAENKGESYVDLLQDLMEKTVVLALATGQKRFSASLCKLVEKYAEILASQGLLTTAMEYLKLMGTEDLSPELVILRDRIALSSEPEKEVTAPANYVHAQPQMPAVYGANHQTNSVVEPARNYYQDENSYQRDSYQQPPAPVYNTQYQQQQPSMFVPTPAAQVPPTGFNPPPVTTQPAPKVFVPSTPPVIRNADQYQQAPTLGSQLYPPQGNANSGYQPGPPGPVSLGPVPSPMVPTGGPKISQGVTPPVRGFMPVNSNTGLQRTSSAQMQPPTPPQPAAPQAAPVTIQTADVTNVPAQQRPVIGTLTRLFNETSEALGGSNAAPAKKREIDDNSKKIGALFTKLNSGDISKNAAEKLVQLCQSLDRGDFATALKIQVDLTTSDWDECSFWLATLKRMIKIRQTVR